MQILTLSGIFGNIVTWYGGTIGQEVEGAGIHKLHKRRVNQFYQAPPETRVSHR